MFKLVKLCFIMLLILTCKLCFSAEKKPLPSESLYASFDKGILPDRASDKIKSKKVRGEYTIVNGIKGKAVMLAGPSKAKLCYKGPGSSVISSSTGTCIFWIKPEWKMTEKKFYFFMSIYSSEGRILLYKFFDKASITLTVQNLKQKRSAKIEHAALGWEKGQWHQLAVSWDKKNTRFYVDGKLAGQHSSFNIGSWKDELYIGTTEPGWAHVGTGNSCFDELQVYNKALSASEIMNKYKKVVYSNPKLKAELDRKLLERKQKVINNLALEHTGTGGMVIASSFANLTTAYYDNLIDNNEETAWTPMDNEYPLYLELRWKYPKLINRLSFLRLPGSVKVTAASVMNRNRVSGKWEKIKSLSAQELKNDRAEFDTIYTDCLRLVIEKAPDKVVFTELEAYGPKQPIPRMSTPHWSAWHIWYPENNNTYVPAAARFFRYKFNLKKIDFLSAYLQARSNDSYSIWVNGKKVPTVSTRVVRLDIKKYLHAGENVIAVKAELKKSPGKWGNGSFIAELTFNYLNRSKNIITNADWKTAKKAGAGWLKPGFNDASWKNSACLSRPPVGPGGYIKFKRLTPGYDIALKEAKIVPGKATPGSKVDLKVTLQATKALPGKYYFRIDSGHPETDKYYGDYFFAREVSKVFTIEKPGNVEITVPIALPPWTTSGKTPINFRAFSAESGVELKLNGHSGAVAELNVINNIKKEGVKGISSIKYTNGQASFDIDGKIVPPFFGRSILYNRPDLLYNMYKFAGIDIHEFTIERFFDTNPEAWNERLATLDNQMRSLVAINPNLTAIIEIDLRPHRRWLKANPKERLITAFGKKDVLSYSSEKYRNLCFKYCKGLVDFLKDKPYWNNIVGFKPWTNQRMDCSMGGTGTNLFQTDRNKITIGDFNPQAIERFREFLRKKYNNDVAALRKAWLKPEVTFENAMPDAKEIVRAPEDDGVFRDPTRGRMRFDYAEFLPTILGSLNLEMCRLFKEQTNWEKMTFISSGFIVAHLRSNCTPGDPYQNNNFNLPDLLKDKAVDGYIGAPSYYHRRTGKPIITYFVWSTYRLYDRMYLVDDDMRYYINFQRRHGRIRSYRESIAAIRRNIGAYITRNIGAWFADYSREVGKKAIPWWSEKEIAAGIGEMNNVYKKAIETGYKSAAEIAVIFSNESSQFLDFFHGPTLLNNTVTFMYFSEFFKLGAPFDVHLIGDLRNPKMRKDYKLYVMMNPYYLSEQDRQAVEKLKRDGKTILWFYAPGYIDMQKGNKVEHISELTGIKTEKLGGKEQMQAQVSNFKHPITQKLDAKHKLRAFALGARQRTMHKAKFGPRFRIVDKRAMILAKFADGKGALAARNFGKWKSIYSIVPRLDGKILRNICRWAGVHLYTDGDLVFDANHNFIVLNNGYEKDKKFNLRLPRKTNIFDAISGKKLGSNTDRIKLKIEKTSTLVLFME